MRRKPTQNEEKRYQIAKDLSDNLTITYNTSEVIDQGVTGCIVANVQEATRPSDGCRSWIAEPFAAGLTKLHGASHGRRLCPAVPGAARFALP